MTPSMSSPNDGSPARRIAITGLLAALALIFSYVEVLFPLNAGIPGIKLGLANLVPLVIMYRMDARYAFAANLIRVLLAGLLFSGLFAALYSLAGSCVSFLIMYLLKKTDRFSIIGVSMAGGVFHNLGQLAVAILLVSGPQLIHYMPVLIISGMAAGLPGRCPHIRAGIWDLPKQEALKQKTASAVRQTQFCAKPVIWAVFPNFVFPGAFTALPTGHTVSGQSHRHCWWYPPWACCAPGAGQCHRNRSARSSHPG